MKEKFISILAFRKYVPPILGGLREKKEYTTPLTDIRTPKLRNDHDGVRGVYPRASKSLQDHILNINAVINRELGHHMKAQLLASKLLGKCSVFWSQLAAEIDSFKLHLVTITYGEGSGVAGKAECW